MRTISFALAAALFATPALAAPPPPYARHVCPNGLEVIVVERHASPLMTVEIAVHNGSMTESPEYNGLSHLYEHMFFKGNKVLPDQLAYSARLRELGMLWNGTTDDDRVNYYFTTTSDHYAGAMAFMRDAITSPLFDKKELDRERVVVTGEMDRDESDPPFLLWRGMEKLVYWKYPSRKNALGDRKTVLSTTPEKMRTIQHRYYVPNNSVLVVTGDVKAEDVFKSADDLYAGWAKAPDPFVKFPLVKHPPIKSSQALVVVQPVQTYSASVEWQGPSTLDASAPHTYAADLLSTLVGDPGSKFQKDLVDSGACVRAAMNWNTVRDVGAISIDFEATEANAGACTSAVVAELAKIEAAGYFSDDELRNAAHVIDVSLAKQREGTESYAHLLTFEWANADEAYYATYSDRVHAVTRGGIAKYLDAYVLGKPFVIGALESPTLAKMIDKAHLEALAGISKGGAK
jgi:zinc protease